MSERRKGIRTILESTLTMKRVDAAEEDVNIEIIDLSKSGLGFISDKKLEIGAMYQSHLTIWTKETIHTYLQITRIEQKEDVFEYGAFFVGMPEMDAARIANYNIIEESLKEMEDNDGK